MYILGISSYYHDSAACLIQDGNIISAAQEERFTRKKHDPSFPHNAIGYCLKEADIQPEQVTYFVFYEKPFMKFDRLIKTHISFFPSGYRYFKESMIEWLNSKIFLKRQLLN